VKEEWRNDEERFFEGAANGQDNGFVRGLGGDGRPLGGIFNLGQTNIVNALSVLTGSVNRARLMLQNTSTGTSATALDLRVASGKLKEGNLLSTRQHQPRREHRLYSVK
jgi:hypothetical protein